MEFANSSSVEFMSCEQGLFHHHDTRTQRQKAPIVLAHLATPNDITNVVAAAAAAVSLRLGVSRRTFPPDLCLPHAENYHHEHRPLVYSYRFKGYDYELGLGFGARVRLLRSELVFTVTVGVGSRQISGGDKCPTFSVLAILHRSTSIHYARPISNYYDRGSGHLPPASQRSLTPSTVYSHPYFTAHR